MSNYKERLRELVHELDCIRYERVKLSSGGISDYKIYCDPLFNNSESRNILAKMGSKMLLDIEKGRTYEIVGVMSGGYDFGKIIADHLGRGLVGIDPHDGTVHGRTSKPRSCITEDVVTKGLSIINCKRTIGSYPLARNAIAIVEREEGGRENLRKAGIDLKTIFTKSELVI